jgi:hypothetical protein
VVHSGFNDRRNEENRKGTFRGKVPHSSQEQATGDFDNITNLRQRVTDDSVITEPSANITGPVVAIPLAPKIRNNGHQCYIIALIQAFFVVGGIISSDCPSPNSPWKDLLLELLCRNYGEEEYDLEEKYYDLFMYNASVMAEMDPAEIIDNNMEFLHPLFEFNTRISKELINNGNTPTFSKLVYHGRSDIRGTYQSNIVLSDDAILEKFSQFRQEFQVASEIFSSQIHVERSLLIGLPPYEDQDELCGNNGQLAETFLHYLENSFGNDGHQGEKFHELDWTKDATSGEDVKILYYVDLDVKHFLVNRDSPKLLMIKFQLSSVNAVGELEKLLVHPRFHVIIPLSLNWLDSEYELIAIIMHHGPNLQSGHYTTLTYHQRKGLWLHADDAKLVWLREGEIPAQCKSSIPNRSIRRNAHPYMLFFRKR